MILSFVKSKEVNDFKQKKLSLVSIVKKVPIKQQKHKNMMNESRQPHYPMLTMVTTLQATIHGHVFLSVQTVFLFGFQTRLRIVWILINNAYPNKREN